MAINQSINNIIAQRHNVANALKRHVNTEQYHMVNLHSTSPFNTHTLMTNW